MSSVPDIRIRNGNDKPVQSDGDYVLYWMIAFRRPYWNFSLQRAAELAAALNKPLVVFEALRTGYRWACDRFHRFILDGMADNERNFSGSGAFYYPYVETAADDGKGLLEALGKSACAVVTDDFPEFFLPRMMKRAGDILPVRLECVDTNGLLPLRATDEVFKTAYAFRRFLQKNLRGHLNDFPKPDPLKGAGLPEIRSLPDAVTKKWPRADEKLLEGDPKILSGLPIDHGVGVTDMKSGHVSADETLKRFVRERLHGYADLKNQPQQAVTSGLSPYLHFGHISAHQVFSEIAAAEDWSPEKLSSKASGSRQGWWGVSETAEAFLDQLVTWRELGYNFCSKRDDYDRYESLPDWARKTLEDHEKDKRPYLYSTDEFEQGATHDPLWNAAQMQLVREGVIHNYLRMLWGKKILEWSKTPRDALAVMIELNNKYGLDGRDPNSYSGIFWTLGRYDRAWGPERPVFGKIRYMTSENTARKVKVKNYIRKYAP